MGVKQVSNCPGALYVVATPIGNLGDLSPRARETLAAVDVVAAEDTRHSQKLLSRYRIARPLLSLHEHNEEARTGVLLARILAGESVALISDAGTPLISDPGYRLVAAVHRAGATVSPIPGPCSPIAALCISGLPTDRFRFEGFLPPKHKARRARIEALAREPETLVFLESPRRIRATLEALAETLGPAREAFLARELTKLHERTDRGTLGELSARAASDPYADRGECVLVVDGCREPANNAGGGRARELLRVLVEELPPARAAVVAARLCGCSRNEAYELALELTGASAPPEP